MKKIVLILLAVIVSSTMGAQSITSFEDFKAHQDSLKNAFSSVLKEWNREIPPYNIEAGKLEEAAKSISDSAERDSLLALAASKRNYAKEKMKFLQDEMNRITTEQNAFEKEYELVFEEAFPYFRLRKRMDKDTLSKILKSASPQIRKSQTGKALKSYISNRQITVGERFRTFTCYDNKGKRFDWKTIKDKKVFLIHDGLWCMTHGTNNSALRKFLAGTVGKHPDCLPLIVVNCATPEELQEDIELYGLHDFIVVSEFKNEFGKLNWLYNDQTAPTCHYINEQGIICNTTEGIDQDYLEKEFLK